MSNNSKASFSSEGYFLLFLQKKNGCGAGLLTHARTPLPTGILLCILQRLGEHSWGFELRAFSSTSLPVVGSSVCLPGSVLQLGEDTPEQGWAKDPASHLSCDPHTHPVWPSLSALCLPGGPHWTGLAAASDQLPALLGAICIPAGALAADPQPPRSP